MEEIPDRLAAKRACEEEVADMCERFLSNPVIEDSRVTITEAAAA